MKYLTEKILKHRADIVGLKKYEYAEIDFIPSDSEENWLSNLKIKKHSYSIQYYLQNPIKYKLNNVGFRTLDDFNFKEEGNVFLGCSHTFGIGHHLENVWAYKLNKTIGGKFWNLGMAGTGVATHFRILLAYYKQLKIKNIFHFAPLYPRYEFIENQQPQNYIIGEYNEDWKVRLGNLLQDSLLTNEQCEMNWITYTNAIKSLANEIGVNYYLIQHHDNHTIGIKDNSLEARDLEHCTTLYHHILYKKFLEMYDLNLTKDINDNLEIFNINKLIKNKKII
jgi:hypothetical protein